jgi:predicted secreted protein
MDLGVVVLIIVAAWIGLFAVVLAMCKAASHADDNEVGVQESGAPQPRRLRPHFHGLHLHRG